MENTDIQQPKYTVGINLKNNSKTFDYDANSLNFRVGDKCVVDTKWGQDVGTVAITKRIACCKRKTKKYKKVVRKATKEDLDKSIMNDKRIKDAHQFCLEKIKERKIDMKLFRVNVNLEATKARFYFTAEGRVDFRALIKDLAQKLGMKIEMRQIGVRDEAKLLGGCGPCGGQLCCTSFLKDFEPVSIKMAKNQNLSLNPLKITGVCGRLLCCLVYENEMYKDMKKEIPKNGTCVKTCEGDGKILNSDIIQQKVYVELEEGKRENFLLSDVTVIGKQEGKGQGKKDQQENKKNRLSPAPKITPYK